MTFGDLGYNFYLFKYPELGKDETELLKLRQKAQLFNSTIILSDYCSVID